MPAQAHRSLLTPVSYRRPLRLVPFRAVATSQQGIRACSLPGGRIGLTWVKMPFSS